MDKSRGLGLEWDAEGPEVGKMKSRAAHPPTGPAFGCAPSKNPLKMSLPSGSYH